MFYEVSREYDMNTNEAAVSKNVIENVSGIISEKRKKMVSPKIETSRQIQEHR